MLPIICLWSRYINATPKKFGTGTNFVLCSYTYGLVISSVLTPCRRAFVITKQVIIRKVSCACSFSWHRA